MMTQVTSRDYSLTGPENTRAVQKGLASAKWFACDIGRQDMKRLMKRADGPAIRHIGLWLGLLVVSGVAAFLSWGTGWCVPAFAVYGVLYAASDHRAHELSHGTPFRTRWLSDALYQLAAFMTLHEAYFWRWSHARHHTDTLVVGRDREIAVTRPPSLLGIVLDLFYLKTGVTEILRTFRHAFGYLRADERQLVPASELKKVFWVARVYVAIFLGTIAWCVAIGSILPAMFIVLPKFYGNPLSQIFNITQHAGLSEDVLDHRLNTRTFLTNPVFQFLYMNMNYHVAHHMFPMVPFYRLAELHRLMRPQCPAPHPSLWSAYKEVIPALLRQRRDPSYAVIPALPGSGLAHAPGESAIVAARMPGATKRSEAGTLSAPMPVASR